MSIDYLVNKYVNKTLSYQEATNLFLQTLDIEVEGRSYHTSILGQNADTRYVPTKVSSKQSKSQSS